MSSDIRDDEHLNAVALQLCSAKDDATVEALLSELHRDDVGTTLAKASTYARDVLLDEQKANWLQSIAAEY